MCTYTTDSYGGGAGFYATDMDPPSSQLIAFVNLDSHPRRTDHHIFSFPLSYPFSFVVLSVFWDHTVLLLAIVCYAICHHFCVRLVVVGEGVIDICPSLTDYVYWHRSSGLP